MNKSENTKTFPQQLARVGWVAGVIAVILISVTARGSGRVAGEFIAFLFVGLGITASVVSLALIPKFGVKGLLWPTLGGIAINGLLLAIAAPNFLQARDRAIGNKSSEDQVGSHKLELWQLQGSRIEMMSGPPIHEVVELGVSKSCFHSNIKNLTQWQHFTVLKKL